MGYSHLRVTLPGRTLMAEKQPSDDKRIARARIEMSEDEIIDRAKARDRATWRMIWVLISGIALVLGATAIAIKSGHAALVSGMWGQIVILAVIGALFAYAFVTIIKYSIRPIERDSPRLVHYRRDSHQRVWRRSILFSVFMMLFVLMSVLRALPVLRGAHPLLLLVGPSVAGFMLLLVFTLSVGPRWSGSPGLPVPDDEFDRDLRARMMRVGYIVVMLLLGAVFLVDLWQPALTLTALIWALYAGFAVPALYYLIADWRASRGSEG